MNFKDNESFFKEHHHLARRYTTAFAQIASDCTVVLPFEFVLKHADKLSSFISFQKAFIVRTIF